MKKELVAGEIKCDICGRVMCVLGERFVCRTNVVIPGYSIGTEIKFMDGSVWVYDDDEILTDNDDMFDVYKDYAIKCEESDTDNADEDDVEYVIDCAMLVGEKGFLTIPFDCLNEKILEGLYTIVGHTPCNGKDKDANGNVIVK